MRVSQNLGYLLGRPDNKDDNSLGSCIGVPYLQKLPYKQIVNLKGGSGNIVPCKACW